MNESEEFLLQMHAVKTGRVSLTEAIHELDLAKEAFARISSIEAQVKRQDTAAAELHNRLANFPTTAQVEVRFDELQQRVERQLQQSLAEAKGLFLPRFDEKVDFLTLEEQLIPKCTWKAHNELVNQLSDLRLLVDKHINTDFINLETKLKLELKNAQAPIILPTDEGLKAQVHELRQQCSKFSKQIRELQSALDGSDHDSDERLDLMLNELQRVVLQEEPQLIERPKRRKRGSDQSSPEQLCRSVLTVKRELDQALQAVTEVKRHAATNSKLVSQTGKQLEQIEALQTRHSDALRRQQESLTKDAERLTTFESLLTRITDSCQRNFTKLEKDAEDKSKRLTTIESHLLKLKKDVAQSSLGSSETMTELAQKLTSLLQDHAEIQQRVDNLNLGMLAVDKKLNEAQDSLRCEISELRGPMTDLISNQDREIQSVVEELRRKQQESRCMIEERLRPDRSCETSMKTHSSRMCTPSPTMSIKHRYHYKNRTLKLKGPAKTDENWLKALEDGQALALPRMKDVAPHSKSKYLSTVSIDFSEKCK